MWHRTFVRAAAVPFAAGLMVAGGSAALASPTTVPAVQVLAPADCDVSEGQPGATPSPGGHANHGTGAGTAPTEDGQMDHTMPGADGQMDHTMPGADGQMDHTMPGAGGDEHGGHGSAGETPTAEDHGEHGSHGASTATAAGPDSASRSLVLGGFAGINGVALAGAGLLRRRTASKRGRHLAARAAARPARTSVSGDER